MESRRRVSPSKRLHVAAAAYFFVGCAAFLFIGQDVDIFGILDGSSSFPRPFETARRCLAEVGIIEREHACASFSTCGDPCDENRANTCTEAIDKCADSIERIDGPIGASLAVLSSNPSYRLKDILLVIGNRWRLDSMTILGEPRYRGTLLRDTLVNTSTWDRYDNGTMVPLSSLSEEEVEDIVRSRSDVEGQPPGTAYLTGYKGGNGIQLAERSRQLSTFAHFLRKMYIEGKCEGVSDSTDNSLIVPYRLGDATWPKAVAEDYAAKILAELTSGANANNVDEQEKAAKAADASGKTTRKKVQIRGALHYGNDCHSGHYFRSKENEEMNVQTLSYFVENLEKGGIDVDILSIPSVDQDICAYLFGQTPREEPNSNRGFHELTKSLARLLA